MFVIWILFICGAGLLLAILASLFLGLTSPSWPTTSGKVLGSSIQTRRSSASSSKIAYYHPVVAYEFMANGRMTISRRLGSYLAFGEKPGEAEAIVARFPTGSAVRVYVHPWLGVSALMPGVKQPVLHAVLGLTALLITAVAGTGLFLDEWHVVFDLVAWVLGDRS